MTLVYLEIAGLAIGLVLMFVVTHVMAAENAALVSANAKLLVALQQAQQNQRALEATVAELQDAILAIARHSSLVTPLPAVTH